MQYLVDIIFVVLGMILIIRAAQKGFVASALNFAFSLLGTAVAWAFAAAFCEQIYVRFFQPTLLSYLNDTANDGDFDVTQDMMTIITYQDYMDSKA